jgi:hypothetical protein
VTLRYESNPWALIDAAVPLAPGERRTLALLAPASARYGTLYASDGTESHREGISWGWMNHDPVLVESVGPEVKTVLRFPATDKGEAPSDSLNPTVSVGQGGLPATLAALVGYAAVGVLSTPFEELPEPQRRALEAYAATGGALYLAQPPAHPESAFPLWRGDRAAGAHPYGFGTVHLCADAARCVEGMRSVGELKRAAEGRSDSDSWSNSRGASVEPLLEVARVPVGGFLLLVLAFVLVIGPGSFVVRARHGPHALLAFIPLTALATCGGIATYGVVHEGLFTLHASSRTATFLDAEHHHAASLSVDGFYASLGPSEVRYGALAGPLLPSDRGSLQIDESDGLSLRGGYIPARAYREHLVAAVSPARARLSLRPGDGTVVLENALGAKIVDGLLVSGGRRCTVQGLADGGRVEAVCGASKESGEEALVRLGKGLEPRFTHAGLKERLLAPLVEGEFLVKLDRAVFAPDGGLRLSRSGDVQVVRGRLSP